METKRNNSKQSRRKTTDRPVISLAKLPTVPLMTTCPIQSALRPAFARFLPDTVADGAFIATEHTNYANERQFVLKAGNTFVVNDTRVLSQLRLTFGGRSPSLLSGSVSSDNAVFTAHLTNRRCRPSAGRPRRKA